MAVCHPVRSLQESGAVREAERRRFHDATHHVLAVRLSSGEWRVDDDGEPSGTGGRPVLRAIDAAGLSDVAVVVTRYYGGTKLGTGGLGRAYGAAAEAALAGVAARSVVRAIRLRITFPYDDTGAISRLIERSHARRMQESWGEEATVVVAVPRSVVERLLGELADETGGRASTERLDGEMLLPLDT